jgi:uncharacterized protein (TIGR03435 family)
VSGGLFAKGTFMTRILLAPAAMLAWAGLSDPARSLGQSKAAPSKFEVAAVKPCKPADLPLNGARGGASGSDPGRTRIVCQTLERLIEWAYVQYANGEPLSSGALPPKDQPIEGSPSWVKSETFTIDAKPESPQTMEMMRGPMLQALLEDRFKLKIHRGTRQVPIYALVVARGGRKLDPAKKDSCTPPPDFSKGLPPLLRPDQPPPCGAFSPDGKGGTRTFGQTLAGLSAEFSAVLGKDVADRTGTEGTFDIHLDVDFNDFFTFTRSAGPDDTPGGQNRVDPFEALGSAVQRLGLRLQSTTGPETFIVIDHVERPSEN